MLTSKAFSKCCADGQAEEKYTANFPYPYMNGVLHVGHGFSLSKVQLADLRVQPISLTLVTAFNDFNLPRDSQ